MSVSRQGLWGFGLRSRPAIARSAGGFRLEWLVGALLTLCLGAGLAQPSAALGRPFHSGRSAATSFNPVLDEVSGLGSWIWTTNTYPRQTCRFWRSFEIPRGAVVVRGVLRMTADNGYLLYLDGRVVGRGADWRLVSEYDLTWLLDPGTHVLAVDAFNDADTTGSNIAGVILGLHIEFSDGQSLDIGTDNHWRIVPDDARDWENRRHAAANWRPARVIGPWGGPRPWQAPLSIRRAPPERPLPVHFWQSGWFQITILTMCGVAVLACLRLMARVALQSKAQQLLQLERARIARDIHDDLGAGLTKLVLLGEVVQSELRPESETRAQIGQLCEKARDLSRAMDEVVWAINSRRDTLADFAAYVCKYAQAFLQATPIRCRLDVEPNLPRVVFELPIRRNLFLVVKEALNNAAKHSGATELYVRIHRQGEGLLLVIEDNGLGFDPLHTNQERNGLANMTQRMKEAGGTCQILSMPGAGCRVDLSLPRLAPRQHSWWRPWPSNANPGGGRRGKGRRSCGSVENRQSL